MNRLALVFIACFLLAGCLEPSGCPEQEGSVLCGLCSDPDSPNAGHCFYCGEGQTCSGDVCGDYKCTTPRTQTPLFTVAGGQPVAGADVVVADGTISYPYENVFIITGEDGEPLEGYNYTVEGELPPGITLTEDGNLTGTPTKAGVYTFSICATSPAGVKTCREVSMSVRLAPPKPSPSPSPTATPTPQPGGLFAGKWDGQMVQYLLGPEGSFPEGCYVIQNVSLDIKQDGNVLSGTTTVTIVEVYYCWPETSQLIGQTQTLPIKGSVSDNTARFSTVEDMAATDYTATIDGGKLNVEVGTCHSPDLRCTCEAPDPRCPGGTDQYGNLLPGKLETKWWWEGFSIDPIGK